MAEKSKQENQQQISKDQVQKVTTKDPKKVEAGKRLAAWNRKQKEELKAQKSNVTSDQYYGIGAILAVGVIGGLGYLYRAKKGEVNVVPPHQPRTQPRPQTNKFEME